MNKTFDEIKKLIGTDHSRSYTDYLVGIIMKRNELFDDVWQIFAAREEDFSRKAAWVLMHAVTQKPGLITPYLDELVEILPKLIHDGEKRNAIKIVSLVEIPERLYGMLVEICFRWLNNTHEATAI
ncbi:MAG: hypothetical protein RQ866_07840, partial [Bacteroidales bacterium]|nr:hypothetical protein [Bacteroidales bacterium]